ncbi:MAG: uncharacterized protein JWQ11_3217 [Rhizobacter sp.]|nr:uncharacterized protein [Rhizobacter sp.]
MTTTKAASTSRTPSTTVSAKQPAADRTVTAAAAPSGPRTPRKAATGPVKAAGKPTPSVARRPNGAADERAAANGKVHAGKESARARARASGNGSAASLHPRSTPDRVADAIIKGILMRRFTVGQRLVEADLTRDLNVSRSTVREALRILSASGVVHLTPHRGAVIRSLDHDDAASLLGVLEVLSGLGARLAAANIGQGDNAKRFAAAAQKLIDADTPEALDRILDERANYYKVLFEIAGSTELDRVLPLPRAHLFRSQFYHYLTTADLRAMVAEYRAITEAILEGDQAKAEQRMRKHLVKSGERTLPRMTTFSLG